MGTSDDVASPRCPGDDLERELVRLEARLADAAAPVTDHERVTGELARVRRDLSRRADGSGPLRLAQVRIASPCQRRWADMVGDDRVRVCNGCERPVFDLSEMTHAEASAVLATRGVTPCVRFYRRADGTVMTADCAPGARDRGRRLAVVAGTVAAGTLLLGGSPAMADVPEPPLESVPAPGPPEPAEPAEPDGVVIEHDYIMGIPAPERTFESLGSTTDGPHRPLVEWSTWFRLGFGTEAHAPRGAARATTPVAVDRASGWEAALGADISVGLPRHGDIRLGAWTEVRTSSDPVLGGELILEAVPRHLDLFQFDGQGVLALRAGGNAHVVTAAIAYGYLAPWSLWGPWNGTTRYMIGVRLVASATRSLADPRDWSATVGLEVEPVGALRYLLSVRSWY